MTLYQIVGDYKKFEEDLDSFVQMIEDGEIDEQAFDDTLEAIQSSFEDKADNIACIIKNTLADVAAIKQEEEILANRRRAKEKAVERLKEYLTDSFAVMGQTKMETARNRISFRKSESVRISNEREFLEWAINSFREDLVTVKEPVANKTAIKAAIKAGEELPGAILEAKMNIQIK